MEARVVDGIFDVRWRDAPALQRNGEPNGGSSTPSRQDGTAWNNVGPWSLERRASASTIERARVHDAPSTKAPLGTGKWRTSSTRSSCAARSAPYCSWAFHRRNHRCGLFASRHPDDVSGLVWRSGRRPDGVWSLMPREALEQAARSSEEPEGSTTTLSLPGQRDAHREQHPRRQAAHRSLAREIGRTPSAHPDVAAPLARALSAQQVELPRLSTKLGACRGATAGTYACASALFGRRCGRGSPECREDSLARAGERAAAFVNGPMGLKGQSTSPPRGGLRPTSRAADVSYGLPAMDREFRALSVTKSDVRWPKGRVTLWNTSPTVRVHLSRLRREPVVVKGRAPHAEKGFCRAALWSW